MVFNKKMFTNLTLTVLFLTIPVFANAVNMNQIIRLKKNGSAFLSLVYWEKESVVKDKNYQIGNLPFSKEKSEAFLSSSNTNLSSFVIGRNQKDNSYIEITASIDVKDITKLNDMKALSEIVVTMRNSDSGNVLNYMIPPSFAKTNSIENVYVIVDYDGTIKSSNGTISSKNVSWYRSKEYLNVQNNIYFVATLESDRKTTENPASNEKGKSCGLFGLEFPAILLFGLAFAGIFKKRN